MPKMKKTSNKNANRCHISRKTFIINKNCLQLISEIYRIKLFSAVRGYFPSIQVTLLVTFVTLSLIYIIFYRTFISGETGGDSRGWQSRVQNSRFLTLYVSSFNVNEGKPSKRQMMRRSFMKWAQFSSFHDEFSLRKSEQNFSCTHRVELLLWI